MTRSSPRSLRTLCFCTLLTVVAATAGAQTLDVAAARTAPLDSPLPSDPTVLTGTFDSGLRYYIRRNTEPRNRALLRLVVNVGSLHENEDERGIAHYLEHMAFNGTEHFEKQSLVRFMESIGMRLGPGINASTSFDQTVYKLSVPTDAPEHLATALQIVEDWIQGLTLDPAEVELERGVVLEEWRGSQGAQSRVRDQQIPVLLHGTRYAERLPIGSEASIKSIDAAKLREFYRRWYRPERMAVIAIGDFDAAAIERLVRDRFAQVPAATGASPEAPDATAPDHAETLFSIVTDREISNQTLQIVHTLPVTADVTHGGIRQRLVRQVGNALLSLRLQEKVLSGSASFLSARSEVSRLTRTIEAQVLGATVTAEGVERGLAGLQHEAARIERHGFTATELERARSGMLRSAQLMAANLDKLPSEQFANAYTESFLTGKPETAPEYEIALLEHYVPNIGLDEINALARSWLDDQNRVILVTLPRKDGVAVPEQQALAKVLDETKNADVARYEDTATPTSLLATPPQGTPVIETRERAGGVIEWVLGNGVRVVLKRTDFNKDLILFRGFLPGGASLAEDDDLVAAQTSAGVVATGGLGNMDLMQLQRVLTGKVAEVRPDVSEAEVGVSGRGAASDLQPLFEQVYLRVTAPRVDATVFEVVLAQLRSSLENRERNPETLFGDAFNRLMTADHVRARPMKLERIKEMDLDRSLAFYRARFADMTGATFIFVGDLDPEQMRPMVERYLGGLPATGRREQWRDRGIRVPPGIHEETVRAGTSPKSATTLAFNGEFDIRNPAERTLFVATGQLLQKHLLELLREDLGATYGVSVEPRLRWLPIGSYAMVINFGSAPERARELLARVFKEIEQLKLTGPTPERVADVRAGMLRAHETNLRKNEYWLAMLTDSYRNEEHPGAENLIAYPDTVNAVTPDAIRDALQRYLRLDHYVRVTLVPAN